MKHCKLRLTPKECSELVKSQYAKWSCRCGKCDEHLSLPDEVALRVLGEYAFATLCKLRSNGVEVEYVVERAKSITGERFADKHE